jgi:plastocyanin
MRKPLVLVLVLALSAVLAATALAATKSIKVGDNYYVRPSGVPTVTINKGDKLKFNFTGDKPHNAIGKGISLGSDCKKVRSSGSCRSSALKKTGTFTIYCAVHGAKDQSMKVRVR